MRFAGNNIFVLLASVLVGANAFGAVGLGIDVLASNGYALLKSKRNGVDYDQTGVDSRDARTRGSVVNIHASAEMNWQLRTDLITHSRRGKGEMFFKCCGSSSFVSQFAGGIGPARIIASWTEDVTRFKGERSQYLLY